MAKKQAAGGDSDDKKSKKKPAKKAAEKKPAKAPAKKAPPRAKKPTKKVPAAKPAEAPAEALEPTSLAEAAAELDEIEDAEVLAETPTAELEAAGELHHTAVDMLDRDLAGAAAAEPEVPAVELSPEEQELQALYGEDLAKPGIAHAEYQDRQTADEDRPMLPEINARDERKAQWQDRRDRRRSRREERERQRDERRQQRGAPGGAPQGPRPEAREGRDQREARPMSQNAANAQAYRPLQPPVAVGREQVAGVEGEALARVGTPLGDAAATVFAQLRNGQPLPVRQLAAMMRKRSLVETDPEQLAPQLKAELLGDERSYRTLGLRPRIVYRGRDLFAPGPVAMSQTADAEAGVASALSRLASATHRALAQRIARATPAGFERLIHAYLVAAGYREIAWVKRVGGISYASALAPGLDRTVLISARSGDQPIDRRGVGELRVGVEAKNLVAGILFSARELSEEAERELERPGRSIAVVCGDQLAATLIAAGVGVVSAAAPLHYVDDQLLDELLAG